jgi:arsenate reductase-like glutaredoxin family protein
MLCCRIWSCPVAPTIYRNPKCSKSRETLALLINRGLSPQAVARPIVVFGDKAAVGRPPERILDIR